MPDSRSILKLAGFPGNLHLALVDPGANLQATVIAAVLVGVAGASFDIVIDAYRIEIDNRIVLSENIQGSPTGTPTAQAIFRLINPPGSSGLGAARSSSATAPFG